MDLPRARRKYPLRPLAPLAVLLLLLGMAAGLARMDFRTWRVDRDLVQIATVQYGDLDVTVAASGRLLSREIELLTSKVEGVVSQLKVKPGDAVESGQVLAELSNPALQNALDIAHFALVGSRAEELSARIDLENELLNLEALLLRERFGLDKARLALEAKRKLIARSLIPQIEFQQAELDVRQWEETLRLEQERLAKARENRLSQLEALHARVRQAEQNLRRAEDDLASLEIRAGMRGVVQDIRVDFGQHLRAGDAVGRLARQDLLYAELQVPSRQASDLGLGQRVEVDTRNGILEGSISRIDPSVRGGNVAVDVDFPSPLPASLRPELQVEGTIFVAEIRQSLFVRKPAYVRAGRRQSVYVLEDEGDYANRTLIEVGRSSVNHIEVLDGLRAGDRIILTESSDWLDHARILLN